MVKLRIGVIGTGTIATSAHLPAIARLRNELDLELVAVADVRPEVAEQAAKRFGAAAWYTNENELLARQDIDLVDICTPEFLHHRQVLAAAAAGKHILCEKPMAPSVAECDEMIEATRQAGVTFMVGHSRRFTRRYQLVRQAIERGDVGEVRLVRENERRPVSMYSVLHLPATHWSPEGDRPWLTLPEYTFGAAMTNAVHETDLARWFAGQDAKSVYAESRINQPGDEVPDFISYTITFENGAIGAAEVVNNLPARFPYAHMMEVFGTEGMIRATDPPMSPYEQWTASGMSFPENFDQLLHVDDAYANEIAAVVKAIREGTPVPLDPWNARQAIALSAAAVESSQTGLPVMLQQATTGGDR